MKVNFFNFDSCKKISDDDFEILERNGCSPKRGDIIISKDGARCLELIFVYGQKEKIVILSSIAIVRLKKGYNPYFFRYYLLSPVAQQIMKDGYVSGSAIPRVILRDFKRVPVPVPRRVETQNKIADILCCLDDKIEINNRTNKTIEEMAKAIFKNWFVDFELFQDGEFEDSELGIIPKGWMVYKIENVISEIEAGNRPKGGVGTLNDGIPSIGAENIIGLGKYDFSKEKYVSEDYFKSMNKGIVKNWDVLLYKDGAQLGRKTMFAQDFPHKKCCVNSHVFILRSNHLITQPYLYFWLDQDSMTQNIVNLNTNSAQPGIN